MSLTCRLSRRLEAVGALILLAYLALIGGTWAVISSFPVRLLSQLIMMSVLGIWLGRRVKDGRGLPATPLDRALLLLLAAVALSTVFSMNRRVSLEGFLIVAGYCLIFYVAFSIADRRAKLLSNALIATSMIVSVGAISELLVWYFGLSPSAGYGVSWLSIAPAGEFIPPTLPRPHLITGNPNLLGGFLAPLVPLIAGLAMQTAETKIRVALWSVFGTVTVAVFASGSRGAMLALAAGLISFAALTVFLTRSRPIAIAGKYIRPIATTALATATALAVAVGWVAASSGGPTGTAQVRLDLWKHALTMFLERPLLGYGPDTFGLALLRHRDPSAPIADLLPHPHNLVLGIAAELGAVGILAGLLLVTTLAVTWTRAFRHSDRALKPEMIGLLGALTAVGVHGVVEDFRIFPLYVVECIVFAALIIAHAPRQPTRSTLLPSCRWLVGPATFAVAISLYFSLANMELDRGATFADAGDWQSAVSYIDSAVLRDPLNNFYSFQSALAHGWLAFAQPKEKVIQLDQAIKTYGRTLESEPNYALNHANLAASLWEAGAANAAIQAMRRAVDLDPTNLTYRLNLARYFADTDREAAERQAIVALKQDAGVMQTYLWQGLMSRGLTQDAILSRVRGELADLPAPERYLRLGRLAIESGDELAAEGQFRSSLTVPPERAEAWEGLGIVLRRSGRVDEALAALLSATDLDPKRASARAQLSSLLLQRDLPDPAERQAGYALFLSPDKTGHLAVARVLRHKGETKEAIEHYRSSLGSSSSVVAYGLSVWHKRGIQRDKVPQLLPVEPTLDDCAIYAEFGAYLESLARRDEAASVHQRWLSFNPLARGWATDVQSGIRPTGDSRWPAFDKAVYTCSGVWPD